MKMSDEGFESVLDTVRDVYNVPTETPREVMWEVISARLGDGQTDVVNLTAERERRTRVSARRVGWAAAAAAVLVLGVGIGRITAPVVSESPIAMPAMSRTALALAAQDHLGRTESLLTTVRTDARAGERIDAATAAQARGLLSQTRLLIDAQAGSDSEVEQLLLDLELVLVQVVGVAETGSMDEARARTEFELALRSLEEGEVLPRIQAALPSGYEGA